VSVAKYDNRDVLKIFEESFLSASNNFSHLKLHPAAITFSFHYRTEFAEHWPSGMFSGPIKQNVLYNVEVM
jgi:hypothetical protein